MGKRETRLYEPDERLHSFCGGVKTGAFVVLAGMQVNESHPHFKVSEVTRSVRRATATQYCRGGGLQSTSRAFTAPFCNFPSFVRPRGSEIKER